MATTAPVSRLLAFILVLPLGGCFTYTALPSSAPDPDPGSFVRAELTDSGMTRLQPFTGSPDRWAQGTLVGISLDSLEMAVEFKGFSSRQDGAVLRRNVSIPREEVAELQLRRLSVVRTGVVVAAGGLAVGLLLRRLVSSSSAPPSDQPPPQF